MMIEDEIKRTLDVFNRQLDKAIVGDYATAQQGPPLTYDRLLSSLADYRLSFGLEVREVPLYGIQVQAKRHKRKSSRRWQKKWLKRFGTVTEYRRILDKGAVLVDKQRGVIYAHPEEIRGIKAATQPYPSNLSSY